MMPKFDRTIQVKNHVKNAASILRDVADALDREADRTMNIDEAEMTINSAISSVGFAAANALSAIASAQHWVDDDRQQDIYNLKHDANKLQERLDHAEGKNL